MSTTEVVEVVAEAPVAVEPTTAKAPARSKKVKRAVAYGQLHIQATFNNTIVTFSDKNGAVLAASSAGACGFRGSKKGTAYAAQVAAEKAGTIAKQQYGLAKVDVFINGVGQGREAAVRAMLGLDIAVESIKDTTGIPHGGCRPKKARRV